MYAAVVLLCLVTFRSWRAVLCAVLPTMLTSILCEALMLVLGIGVKVATLPVIALGVGIGVDYALYVMSIVLAQMRQGASLSEAYYRALLFTGKVVMLTGVTLTVGVGTWVFFRRLNSRPIWACCWPLCSSGTWPAPWCCYRR